MRVQRGQSIVVHRLNGTSVHRGAYIDERVVVVRPTRHRFLRRHLAVLLKDLPPTLIH
jgi:hypothetical protein